MTFLRLLVLTILVAPVASCAGSIITLGGVVASDGSGYGGSNGPGELVFGVLFFAAIGTFVALFFVLFALVVLALPLTMILDRLKLPAIARDAILIVTAIAVGVLLFQPMIGETGQEWDWIMVGYCLTSAVAWVVGLRLLARRYRKREPLEERFR